MKRARARSIEAALEVGRTVYLRRPTRGDRREWCELRAQSSDFLTPWEPIPPSGKRASDDDAFERLMGGHDTPARQRHLIVRTKDEAIVGMVNLNEIVRHPWHNTIMGYFVFAPFARMGYGAAGVTLGVRRALLPEVESGLGLHRVEANVMPTNAASIALVRRVGFRFEGISPNYLQIAGRWEDHTRWALTTEDPAAKRILRSRRTPGGRHKKS